MLNRTLPNNDNNADQEEAPITLSTKCEVFFNEALCKYRSDLYFKARQLKRVAKITDTWTVDGRVKIKDNNNHISSIDQIADLSQYQ